MKKILISAFFIILLITSCSEKDDIELEYFCKELDYKISDNFHVKNICRLSNDRILIHAKNKDRNEILIADNNCETVISVDYEEKEKNCYVDCISDEEDRCYILIQNYENLKIDSTCKIALYEITEDGKVKEKKELKSLEEIAERNGEFYISKFTNISENEYYVETWNDCYKININEDLLEQTSKTTDYSEKDELPDNINWLDFNIDYSKIEAYTQTESTGDYIVYVYNSGFYNIYLSERVEEDSDKNNQTKLSIGFLEPSKELEMKIVEYNLKQNRIKIQIEKYYDKENTDRLSSLMLDIASGKTPDIIVSNNPYDYRMFGSKGLFADLYSMMDDDISKSDFVENIIGALEFDSRLYCIPVSFDIISYAVKSKYGLTEGWDNKELFDFYMNNQDKNLLNSKNSKNKVFNIFKYSLNKYIDYKNYSCRFDSDEFREILAFCNLFYDINNEQEYWWSDSFDYYEENQLYKKDINLLKEIDINDIRKYLYIKNEIFDDEVTFVGAPSVKGNGALIIYYNMIGIAESSSNKEEAWELLKFILNEDDQEALCAGKTFSVLNKTFEIQCDDATKNPHYFADNKKIYLEDQEESEEQEDDQDESDKIEYDILSFEERNMMEKYVRSAEEAGARLPANVEQIIDEEVMNYFNGVTELKECSENIQKKVSLYLQEIR